jgi:hypothetical protein
MGGQMMPTPSMARLPDIAQGRTGRITGQYGTGCITFTWENSAIAFNRCHTKMPDPGWFGVGKVLQMLAIFNILPAGAGRH